MNAYRTYGYASRIGRVIVMLLFCAGVQGQGGDSFLIVDDPRPVAEAVIQLMKRHPVVVTYEDPRYTYAGDLKDVTDEIRNPQAPPPTDGTRIRVPVGGTLQIRYAVSTANRPVDLRTTLESIVQAKIAVPTGGRFRVEQSGGVFHVIASEVRDASGLWVKHTSVLDVPITLKSGVRSGYKTVRAILDEVTATTGVEFEVTAVGAHIGDASGIEADNEPARDVLLRTLQATSERLTWLLYYDALTDGYYFNIVAASADPISEIRGKPRTSPRPSDPTPTGIPVGESRSPN